MPPPPTVTSHVSDHASWEMAVRGAHPAVGGTLRYCGYVEHSTVPVRRLEVPHGNVVVILSFGEPITVGSGSARRTQRSFVAGPSDQPSVTEFTGSQAGVQLDLPPLVAHRLLGVPMSELANEVVALDDLALRWLSPLAGRLAEQPSWEGRFALLDEVLARRSAEARPVDGAIAWAWAQLVGAHGAVPVGVLADEVGWSRRHFVQRFRQQVGLAPKPTAQVLRFRRAVELLRRPAAPGIGDVAATCGYADHSHLVRDFRRLAGCTPSAYLAAALEPGQNGVTAVG